MFTLKKKRTLILSSLSNFPFSFSFQVEGTTATESLLDLLPALCRDLRWEIYPHYPTILHSVIRLLDYTDADMLEDLFRAIGFIFKYLQKQFIENLESLFVVYSSLLVHEKEYVRSFAAESFAYLLRRLPASSLSRQVERMTNCDVLLDVLYQAVLAEDKREVEEEREEEKERLEKEKREREEREEEERERGMEVDESEETQQDQEEQEGSQGEKKLLEIKEKRKSDKERNLEDEEGRIARVAASFSLYVDGITRLIFSSVKGVRGGLHSKAHDIFAALLSSISPPPSSSPSSHSFSTSDAILKGLKEEIGERELEGKRKGMLMKVLGLTMEGTNSSSMSPLWEAFDKLWKSYLSSFKSSPSRSAPSVSNIKDFCLLLAGVQKLVSFRGGKHSLPQKNLWENLSQTLLSDVWEWVFGKEGGEEGEREAGVELLDGVLGLHRDGYGLLVAQSGGEGRGERELPPAFLKYLAPSLPSLLKLMERGRVDAHIRSVSRYLQGVCLFPSFSSLFLEFVVGYVGKLWENTEQRFSFFFFLFFSFVCIFAYLFVCLTPPSPQKKTQNKEGEEARNRRKRAHSAPIPQSFTRL